MQVTGGTFIGYEGGLTQAPPSVRSSSGNNVGASADWCFGVAEKVCPTVPAVREACRSTLQGACLIGGLLLIGLLTLVLLLALVTG